MSLSPCRGLPFGRRRSMSLPSLPPGVASRLAVPGVGPRLPPHLGLWHCFPGSQPLPLARPLAPGYRFPALPAYGTRPRFPIIGVGSLGPWPSVPGLRVWAPAHGSRSLAIGIGPRRPALGPWHWASAPGSLALGPCSRARLPPTGGHGPAPWSDIGFSEVSAEYSTGTSGKRMHPWHITPMVLL